jgi:hypothetical protein
MLDRQTFVFSATLTVPDSVRRKLKRGSSREARDGKKEKGNETKGKGDKASHTLSGLMEAVPFYGRVKLVDLTDQSRTVAERVAESALECTEVRVFPFPFFCFFFSRARFADERPRRVGGDYTCASVLNYRVDTCHTQTLRASYEPCASRPLRFAVFTASSPARATRREDVFS